MQIFQNRLCLFVPIVTVTDWLWDICNFPVLSCWPEIKVLYSMCLVFPAINISIVFSLEWVLQNLENPTRQKWKLTSELNIYYWFYYYAYTKVRNKTDLVFTAFYIVGKKFRFISFFFHRHWKWHGLSACSGHGRAVFSEEKSTCTRAQYHGNRVWSFPDDCLTEVPLHWIWVEECHVHPGGHLPEPLCLRGT